MAERRMFSKSVVQSARFLKMPLTTQALYFQLGVSADDDGIVEAFTVIRMVGAAEDDLRLLFGKGFIKILNEDLLAYITDWNENNFIRKDRYRPSIHHDLLVQVLSTDNQAARSCQPIDNQQETNGQPRLGKGSLGKDRIDQDRKTPPGKEKEVGLREGNEENREIPPSVPQGGSAQQPDGHCAGGGVFSEGFKEFLTLFPEKTPGGSKLIAWDQWQGLNPDKAQEHEICKQTIALLRDRPGLLPSYILGQYKHQPTEKR